MPHAILDLFVSVGATRRGSVSGVCWGSRIASARNVVTGCVTTLSAISRSRASAVWDARPVSSPVKQSSFLRAELVRPLLSLVVLMVIEGTAHGGAGIAGCLVASKIV